MAALQLDNLNARIDQLEVDSAVTKAELLDVLRQMQEQKQSVVDDVQIAFANVQNRIEYIINDASREFKDLKQNQSTNYNDLFSRMKASVDMLEDRLKGLEGRPGGDYRGGGGSFKQQGYLPLKVIIPEQLGKQPEKC